MVKNKGAKRKLISVAALLLVVMLISLYVGSIVGNKGKKDELKYEVTEGTIEYLNKDSIMYWSPDESKGKVYRLDRQSAVVILDEGEGIEWKKVWYGGRDGWIKKKDLTNKKTEIEEEYGISIYHAKEGKNGFNNAYRAATVYNSKLQTRNVLTSHIRVMESYGADMETFLKEHPVTVEIRDYKGTGSGGEYHYRNDKDKPSKLVLSAYADHGTVTEYILIHEFGHHVGYKVSHAGNDFRDFSNYKDITKVEVGNKWANTNVEKYAEAHAEAYLEGYENKSSTGNFKTEGEKMRFIGWEISKINGDKKVAK